MKKPKIIVVMPAYNAGRTLQKTIDDIPKEIVDEIIIVDDSSKDDTVAVAKKMARESSWLVEEAVNSESEEPKKTNVYKDRKVLLTVRRHDKNRGYGGNQKTCYELALKKGGDIVVMIHPDYQYDPKLIKHFVEFISEGYFDVMLGSRVRSRAETLKAGMPGYKYFANRALTFFQNLVTGQNLSEWHTGMRAYSGKVLEKVPFESFSDDFIFDTQMLFGIIKLGFLIGDIPVPCRYFAEASSINFRRSLKYGILTIWESLKYLLKK